MTVQVTVDSAQVERLIQRFPRIVYERVRSWVFRTFLDHREAWLRRKGRRFGRGGRGIKVHRVGEGPEVPGHLDVIYHVGGPRKVASDAEAQRLLPKFEARIGTPSWILKQHQEGAVITTGRPMAIPWRTRPGTPEKWRRQFPDRMLVARRSRSGRLWLYELQPLKRGPNRYRWIPRFLLTNRVTVRKTLLLYETWDALAALRATKWDEAVGQMEALAKATK